MTDMVLTHRCTPASAISHRLRLQRWSDISPERANLFWRTQVARRATRTGSDRQRVGGESAQAGSTTTVVGHARPGGFRENLLMSSDIGASERATAISRTSLFRESVTCELEERHGSNL